MLLIFYVQFVHKHSGRKVDGRGKKRHNKKDDDSEGKTMKAHIAAAAPRAYHFGEGHCAGSNHAAGGPAGRTRAARPLFRAGAEPFAFGRRGRRAFADASGCSEKRRRTGGLQGRCHAPQPPVDGFGAA